MQTPLIQDQSTFGRFSALLDQLKIQKQNCLLIHDVDGDGLSSGKTLIESFQKLGIKVKFRFAAYDRTNLFGDFLLEFIKKNNITTIFTTDLGIYSTNFKDKKELLKDKTIVVFDHHEKPEVIDSNVLYFHPITTYGFNEPSQYCSSKLVYDLLSNFTNLSDLDWVASVGIVADSNYKTWGDFVDATLTKLNLPIPESPFDSELQKVGTFLYYALAMDKESSDKAVKSYFKAKDYQEALELLSGYEVVGEEIDSILQTWEKYTEKVGDIYFIIIEPKYKINSIISNKLSYQYEHKTIIVGAQNVPEEGSEKEPIMSFSLRRQDGKVNLTLLLKEMVTLLPGLAAGGHRQASGARCFAKDYQKFKELFVKLYEKYRR